MHTPPAASTQNTFQLNVTFLTSSAMGVVFYASGSQGYVCLSIENGLVVLTLTTNTTTLSISSLGPVNDSKWHGISARWEGHEGTLQVDGTTSIPQVSSQTFIPASHLFVGGIPRGYSVIPPVGTNTGFEGCMRDLSINTHPVDIVADALYGVDVSTCVLPACYNVTCQNGGKCVNLASGTYVCECAYGFKGMLCETLAFPCASNPCLFGGICSVINDKYSCLCISGRQGPTCNETGEWASYI